MKFLRRMMIILLLIMLTCGGILVYKGYKIYDEAITQISIRDKVNEIKMQENFTQYEGLPKDYINAVIAVEDKRFFKHKGIDIISIGRAIWVDVSKWSLEEGGSTITQQLAKNIYFTQSKKATRKIAEMFMAISIEKECSKEEIFELYVNTSYFGDGYYCVKDASNGYFDKIPADMNLYECSLLAGIPNAPSVYAPTKNPDLAKQRQAQVLRKMIGENYITQEQADEVKAIDYEESYNN